MGEQREVLGLHHNVCVCKQIYRNGVLWPQYTSEMPVQMIFGGRPDA